jgi:mRNA interferase MazF
MPNFKQGDVIKVPFPYTDSPARKSRPALVISTGTLEKQHGLLWVAMITSAGNRAWPEDVEVSNLKQAGLPYPSVVRSAKIATIEASDAAKIGSVNPARLKQVKERIVMELGY